MTYAPESGLWKLVSQRQAGSRVDPAHGLDAVANKSQVSAVNNGAVYS